MPPCNNKNPSRDKKKKNPDKSKPLSQIKPFTDSWQNDILLYRPRPQLLIDSGVSLWFYHRLALSELSSVHHCFDSRAGVDKNVS